MYAGCVARVQDVDRTQAAELVCVLLPHQPAAANAEWEEEVIDCQHAQTLAVCNCRGWSRRTWQTRIGEHMRLPCSTAQCSGSHPAAVTMTSAPRLGTHTQAAVQSPSRSSRCYATVECGRTLLWQERQPTSTSAPPACQASSCPRSTC